MKIENEAGAIVYFAQNCRRMGYDIEAMNTGYPDSVVRRLSDGLLIRTEFEYESKSFFSHGHDPRECDLIICWRHTGLETPIPIIELETAGMGISFDIKFASESEKELQYYKDLTRRLKNEIKAMEREITLLRETIDNSATSKEPAFPTGIYTNQEAMGKVLELLQTSPYMTKTKLAEEAGISRVTLYRYLDIINRDELLYQAETNTGKVKEDGPYYDA